MKFSPLSLEIVRPVYDFKSAKHHLSHIGLCVHSTADNTEVFRWGFSRPAIKPNNPRFVVFREEERVERSVPLHKGSSLVVGLALKCPYLPDIEDSLLVQATGVVEQQEMLGTKTLRISLFEIATPDSMSPPEQNVVFVLTAEARFEDEDVYGPGSLASYSYPEISRNFMERRFPGILESKAAEAAGAKTPFFRFGSSIRKVCTSSDWIGGRPYPFFVMAPRNIRRQRARVEFLNSLISVARAWVNQYESETTTDPEMRWAQVACQLGANIFPYTNDYSVTAFRRELDDVRDITFSPAVFGFGDCEDLGYVACSLWLLLRDFKGLAGPDWARVQGRMKAEYRDPTVLYCRVPVVGNETESHASCVVIGKDPASNWILLDGVNPYNSFAKNPEPVNQLYDELAGLCKIWIFDDARLERATNKTSAFSRQSAVAYLVDAEGTCYFPKEEGADFRSLDSINNFRESVLDDLYQKDDQSRMLKPTPPIIFGEIKKTESKNTKKAGFVGRLLFIDGDFDRLMSDMKNVGITKKYNLRKETLEVPVIADDRRGVKGGVRTVFVVHFFSKSADPKKK